MNKRLTILLIAAISFVLQAAAQDIRVEYLNPRTSSIRVMDTTKKYLLLPIEETAPECVVKVISDNRTISTLNIRLAKNTVDYLVPFSLTPFEEDGVLLDVVSPYSNDSPAYWAGQISLSDEFQISGCDRWRPSFHHTPPYAWMNDPNGMFFLDGVWHLYYQYGPYALVWNNMHWGHSTSTDLVNWKEEEIALYPDALGQIFSGSCVVDKNNTAGFGKGAIVAMYTTAGDVQRQNIAYSTDGGYTFTKYSHNPVLSADIPDFRDPNMFWNDRIGRWNLILAAGQEVRIYSSPDLKDWQEESRFGREYGAHGGVWECPDLIPVDGKWVLVCNINPGGPSGGSATQYFIGSFDGHQFKCEDEPDETKWMDYGKDHYATVSFSNAPDNRKTVIAWMSNWEYAAKVPTEQFRSANSIARDLFLYDADGETYVGCRPCHEYDGGVLNAILPDSDKTVKVRGSKEWVIYNDQGDKARIEYDEKTMTLSFTRTESGVTDFAASFPTTTVAPVHRKLKTIRIIVDNSSVEIFGNDGEVCLTNLVFPETPLTKIRTCKK